MDAHTVTTSKRPTDPAPFIPRGQRVAVAWDTTDLAYDEENIRAHSALIRRMLGMV